MSFWQTQSWKNLLLKSNQASEVFEIDGIFVEKRSIWLGKYWLFVLGLDKEFSLELEQKLVLLCKQKNCLFIQVEDLDYENLLENKYEFFKSGYYKKFITPYTAVIDLSKNIDEILALMKPKWRYNIKLAEKKWLKSEIVQKTQENIKIFYDLMLETTSRDNFNGNKLEYYVDFLENIKNSELIFVYFEEKVVCAWIFVFEKDVSIYYYWASTSDKVYRNLMWPYLMQYFAIQKSIEIWSKIYDFLWVATPWELNSHLAWVTDFKLKFTSDVRNISNSYIFINNKVLYLIIQILRKIKK